MGIRLYPPPDPSSTLDSPAFQGWLQTLFRLFGLGNLGPSTVALLPTGAIEGQTAYAINGRKIGEAAGLGTGVPVYFSNNAWRVFSTDAIVAA